MKGEGRRRERQWHVSKMPGVVSIFLLASDPDSIFEAKKKVMH